METHSLASDEDYIDSEGDEVDEEASDNDISDQWSPSKMAVKFIAPG